MNYKKTLNMPQTLFPMKGNLSKTELKINEYWKNSQIYNKVLQKTSYQQKFSFLQGPPYANNNIHLGTALNIIIKDAIIKNKWLNNYHAPFVLGWDTHGLPLENVILEKNKDAQNWDRKKFYETTKEYAINQLEIQKSQFERLGVIVDKKYYFTSDIKYIEKQLNLFNELRKLGYIYQAKKPVFWTPYKKTALADAEIEYKEKESWSLYFTFHLSSNTKLPKETKLIIWTTTPWTLLVNQAVAINENFSYLLISYHDRHYIIGEDALFKLKKEFGWENYQIIKKLSSNDLLGLKYTNILTGQINPIVLSSHVTNESGTMLVHIAPAHGPEDYQLSHKYNLKLVNAVNEDGFIICNNKYNKKYYEKAATLIVEDLIAMGNVVHSHKFLHQTPVDWRIKKPVYYLASKQIFLDLKKLVNYIDKNLDLIKYQPSWAKERLTKMLHLRQEWCISRQRKYGVPLIIVYDENNQIVNDNAVYNDILEVISKKGVLAWYDLPLNKLISNHVQQQFPVDKWRKEIDIMDVWFDSGSAFLAAYNDQMTEYDLIVEGNDQFRGWFNSMMFLSLALYQKTPYKNLLVHGFIVDKNQKKMSKSLNNFIDPIKVVNDSGADILRLFFLSSDIYSDISYNQQFIQQIALKYRKIRNTFRYLLGNLNDIKSYEFAHINEDSIYFVSHLLPIDNYILNKIQKLHIQIENFYTKFEFHKIINELFEFITNDLSAFYLDYCKDILYVEKSTSERVLQIKYVQYEILSILLKLFGPIIPYTCEEAYLSGNELFHNNKASIFLHNFKTSAFLDIEFKVVEKQWELFFKVRNAINQQIDILQKDQQIQTRQELELKLQLDSSVAQQFANFDLKSYLLLANVVIIDQVQKNQMQNFSFSLNKFSGEKCLRCWKYFSINDLKIFENDLLCLSCHEIISTL